MNIEVLSKRVKASVVKLQVVGNENGDLVVRFKQGSVTNFVTNSSNTEIKTFREPRTVAKFLEKAGVQQYEIELSNWNIEKIFDRHKAASALKVSASS